MWNRTMQPLLLTATKILPHSKMDATPQSLAPVMQVRICLSQLSHLLTHYAQCETIFCIDIQLFIFFVFPEPSTSKASLNFQDVLSRPPLNRSHLHFPTQDSSPALGGSNFLFSQPSTSTASFPASPFAVTSNFSLVKEIKDSSSQHEDDNISTTSGFSSRASDKGETQLQCDNICLTLPTFLCSSNQ